MSGSEIWRDSSDEKACTDELFVLYYQDYRPDGHGEKI